MGDRKQITCWQCWRKACETCSEGEIQIWIFWVFGLSLNIYIWIQRRLMWQWEIYEVQISSFWGQKVQSTNIWWRMCNDEMSYIRWVLDLVIHFFDFQNFIQLTSKFGYKFGIFVHVFKMDIWQRFWSTLCAIKFFCTDHLGIFGCILKRETNSNCLKLILCAFWCVSSRVSVAVSVAPQNTTSSMELLLFVQLSIRTVYLKTGGSTWMTWTLKTKT